MPSGLGSLPLPDLEVTAIGRGIDRDVPHARSGRFVDCMPCDLDTSDLCPIVM